MSAFTFFQIGFILAYVVTGVIAMVLEGEEILPEMPMWTIMGGIVAGIVSLGFCINLGIYGVF
jgi:hypothetical protein